MVIDLTVNFTVVIVPATELTQNIPLIIHNPAGIIDTPGTSDTVQKFSILTDPSANTRDTRSSTSTPVTGNLVSISL